MPDKVEPSGGVIWEPTPSDLAKSNLHRFMRRHGIATYAELLARSTADVEWFWDAVVKDLDIAWYRPYQQVLDTSRGLPWSTWFTGGQLNLANDCVDKHVLTHRRNKVAVVWEGEEGVSRQLTYWELHREANRLAHGLRSVGVGRGDRVSILMPMMPETVVAVLAVAKVGAICAPIFSGYAPPAIATRLQDSEAKLLITADGYYRRGMPVALKAAADEAVAVSPTVKHVVVVRRIGAEVAWQQGRDVAWSDLVAGQPGEFATERMDSEDTCMLLYTSGTTGRPKGAVHAHAGFPLKAAQDMAHLFDLQESDLMFWFTDLGWMMGPWLIYGTLMLGSTMLLYDGAPDFPGPDRLWSLVERYGVTHLGISPTVIRALMASGEAPVRRHQLASLRVLGSTGEPWNPGPYMWYFRTVGGERCPIINYSGGTEISGGIVGATVVQPIKPMSFTGPVPGMAADVVDEEGRSVRGQVGELVIRKPWPGMTRGFWRDGERYLEAYWSRWPDIWAHGDWASVDMDGFWYIHGRSDDTIKVAGKRLGPAEVESVLVAHPDVMEAAAIGVPHQVKGEALVGFVVLRPGASPAETLRQELMEQLVAALGKALRPERILFAATLPKTRNAKIMRRVIRAVYLGQSPGDLSAMENQDSLQAITHAI